MGKMVKFKRKSNGEVLKLNADEDKCQIETLRMSDKFKELILL